jgi:hypothetical protein
MLGDLFVDATAAVAASTAAATSVTRTASFVFPMVFLLSIS